VITLQQYKELALSLADVEELPHFNIPSFRYKGKIFATYWVKENRAMVKLSLEDQSVFCGFDKTIFFPVDGAWGKQGATLIELKKVRRDMFKDALTLAYKGVAQEKGKVKRK
jgi:hypothetical protein